MAVPTPWSNLAKLDAMARYNWHYHQVSTACTSMSLVSVWQLLRAQLRLAEAGAAEREGWDEMDVYRDQRWAVIDALTDALIDRGLAPVWASMPPRSVA